MSDYEWLQCPTRARLEALDLSKVWENVVTRRKGCPLCTVVLGYNLANAVVDAPAAMSSASEVVNGTCPDRGESECFDSHGCTWNEEDIDFVRQPASWLPHMQ